MIIVLKIIDRMKLYGKIIITIQGSNDVYAGDWLIDNWGNYSQVIFRAFLAGTLADRLKREQKKIVVVEVDRNPVGTQLRLKKKPRV